MTKSEFVSALNKWGAIGEPFLFIADFELLDPLAFPLRSLDPGDILYNINGVTNNFLEHVHGTPEIIDRRVIPFEEYRNKFNVVFDRLSYGDSYLVNLTCPTEITLSHTLKEIFFASTAKYKLYFRGKFIVFSPECFVRIENGRIFSFPMKGTIDASIPDAEKLILRDEKELAEHVTIVDLLRNDLSRVATDVVVTRFRYIEEIVTRSKNLLQVSSEIRGELGPQWKEQMGDILLHLLPAGSVSGAPKKKTVDIIQQAEAEPRGYYTGVFGYFDGERLDSGVMIRYIEKQNDRYFYRSGGGITTRSDAEKEYQEMIDKVYVPVA